MLAAAKGRRQVLSYSSGRVIQPEGDDELPFRASSRSTSADFFAMFDTPFLYGSGWDRSADDNEEYVVVINREINERVFGGENSVGRTSRDEWFTVSGDRRDWTTGSRCRSFTT